MIYDSHHLPHRCPYAYGSHQAPSLQWVPLWSRTVTSHLPPHRFPHNPWQSPATLSSTDALLSMTVNSHYLPHRCPYNLWKSPVTFSPMEPSWSMIVTFTCLLHRYPYDLWHPTSPTKLLPPNLHTPSVYLHTSIHSFAPSPPLHPSHSDFLKSVFCWRGMRVKFQSFCYLFFSCAMRVLSIMDQPTVPVNNTPLIIATSSQGSTLPILTNWNLCRKQCCGERAVFLQLQRASGSFFMLMLLLNQSNPTCLLNIWKLVTGQKLSLPY